MSYHQIFISLSIHDAHEWDRNLRLLFNTKWRSLANFCRENFLRQSKHLTRLLFTVQHQYQIWVTDYFKPCSYVYTCLSTFTTNLYLLIYFKNLNSLALLYDHNNVSTVIPSSPCKLSFKPSPSHSLLIQGNRTFYFIHFWILPH